jgi:hypothetical protein
VTDSSTSDSSMLGGFVLSSDGSQLLKEGNLLTRLHQPEIPGTRHCLRLETPGAHG